MRPFERCLCGANLKWSENIDDDKVFRCSDRGCSISFSQTTRRYPYSNNSLLFVEGQLRYFTCKVDDETVVIDYRFSDDFTVYIKPEYMFGTFIGGVCKGKKVKTIRDKIKVWILYS